MKPFTVNARDYGLALIRRVNRLMLGGAVALAGLFSVAAAKSFHGHQHRATAAIPSTTRSSAPADSGAASSGSGLQAPAQLPAPVQQVPAPVQQAPVVSGGS
jgi:hypothetical protein